jgi:hypothetical protein
MMRLCTLHSEKVPMIKEMTTLESRERKGGKGTRRRSLSLLAVGKGAGALGDLPELPFLKNGACGYV